MHSSTSYVSCGEIESIHPVPSSNSAQMLAFFYTGSAPKHITFNSDPPIRLIQFFLQVLGVFFPILLVNKEVLTGGPVIF